MSRLSLSSLKSVFQYSMQIVCCFMMIVVISFPKTTLSEGNVGCKFVHILCVQNTEVCFDDNVFGKCIPTSGVGGFELEKMNINDRQSRYLATMLEDFQSVGLDWINPYVQCRVQGALFSIQKNIHLPPNLCNDLTATTMEDTYDTNLPLSFVGLLPTEHKTVDKYFYPNPIKKQSNTYYVPENSNYRTITLLHPRDTNPYSKVIHMFNEPSKHVSRYIEFNNHMEAQVNPKSNTFENFLKNKRNWIGLQNKFDNRKVKNDRTEDLRNHLELYQSLSASGTNPQPKLLQSQILKRRTDKRLMSFSVMEKVGILLPKHNRNVEINRDFSDNNSLLLDLLQAVFNEPIHKQQVHSQFPSYEMFLNNSALSPYTYVTQHRYYNDLLRNSLTPFEEVALLTDSYGGRSKQIPDLTESSKLMMDDNFYRRLSNGQINVNTLWRKQNAHDLLASMLRFTRSEPGRLAMSSPLFEQLIEKMTKSFHKVTVQNNGNFSHQSAQSIPFEANKAKKIIHRNDIAPHTDKTEYTHVIVKNPINVWSDGVRLVNELANILRMQGYFTYLSVRPYEVSFRVDSNNPEHKTAADIARAINENSGIKNNLLRQLGITVLNARYGDRRHFEDAIDVNSTSSDSPDTTFSEVSARSRDMTHFMMYLFAGSGISLILLIFIALILIRQKSRKRSKLYVLQEASSKTTDICSKDYQDLCRARMAGVRNVSTSTDVKSVLAAGRITSLARDGERSASSNWSSTSSWSEEANLTNMDISTGHMILSYMEDHLRNQDRLQREWNVLCHYEAEPNNRNAALQPQCAKLNREGAPLPYDHSRVILNHLINADDVDYINASIITDHDPRAPAYVAAQGPLTASLTHFWQMIWEQGAVVIVALCHIQENNTGTSCIQYWPDEGAHVYHIYEVNLVSEHIWCDDYLVRSFYLKNLRTSETRTVTQFHFLSWPANGVPLQAKPLLEFRRKVNKSYRGRLCPIVVHGSSGAGRTGAYILLDLVLGRMHKGAREIDIAATLEHLRDQRDGLVATKQQFEFVLMAVAEEVHAILQALPINQVSVLTERTGIKDEGTCLQVAGLLSTTATSSTRSVTTTSVNAYNSRLDSKRIM